MVVLTIVVVGIFMVSILILIAMGILPKLWEHKIIKENSTVEDIIDSVNSSCVVHAIAVGSFFAGIILVMAVMFTTNEIARYDERDYDVSALAKEFVQKAKEDDNYSVVFESLTVINILILLFASTSGEKAMLLPFLG